jgi:phosphoribosylanthranilate isomerase
MPPVATVAPGRLDAARVVHSRVNGVEAGGVLVDERDMSLSQAVEYLRANGVQLTRPALKKRCQQNKMGRKIGHQWVISLDELKSLVEDESSRRQDR